MDGVRFYTEISPTEGNPRAARPSLDAPFRRYSRTDAEVERDGYETGLRWTDTYRPGGPWSSGYDPQRDHPDWVAYAKTLERHRELWLQAFDRGLARQREARAWTPLPRPSFSALSSATS
jgi:hypothetical protein